jgi:hypothetical protein
VWICKQITILNFYQFSSRLWTFLKFLYASIKVCNTFSFCLFKAQCLVSLFLMLHRFSKELHNLYSPPSIIRHIKSRRMRWARHVARTREDRKCKRFWWESLKEWDHSEDRGVDGRMGSGWVLGRLVGGCGVDSTGSGQGLVAGSCECGDGPSVSSATEFVCLLVSSFRHSFRCFFF